MENVDFRRDVLPLKNGLFRLALRIIPDKAEAEDIVQDTMLKVWGQRDNLAGLDSLEAYCLTLCRNVALDHLRAERRRAGLREPQDDEATGTIQTDIPARTDGPDRKAALHDSVRLVRQIMDDLPEKQRSAMHLRDFEGLSYKEIADILSQTEQQVKTNIFRARQTIKRIFTQTDNYGL